MSVSAPRFKKKGPAEVAASPSHGPAPLETTLNGHDPITAPRFRQKKRPAARPAQPDPILPIYREWVAARAEGGDDHAATGFEAAAFRVMAGLTPTSQAGIAALATLLWSLHGPSVQPEHERYAEECADPTAMLIAAIWRAASGRVGVPDEVIDLPSGEAHNGIPD